MLETVITYFYFLPFYPLVVFGYALESELFLQLIIWFVLGCFVGHYLRSFGKSYLFLAWLVIWFMPGTIICGSATMVPWFTTIWVALSTGGCSNLFSLSFSLAVNSIIVFGVRFIYVWYKQRKIAA